jgi:hypothetical protein
LKMVEKGFKKFETSTKKLWKYLKSVEKGKKSKKISQQEQKTNYASFRKPGNRAISRRKSRRKFTLNCKKTHRESFSLKFISNLTFNFVCHRKKSCFTDEFSRSKGISDIRLQEFSSLRL